MEAAFRSVSGLAGDGERLDAFRSYMFLQRNSSRHRQHAPRDQWLVRKMRKAPEKMKCRITAWWPHSTDLIFPEPHDLEQKSFPQFMHITNTYRAKWIDSGLQKAFLEDALRLSDEERHDQASLAVVPENF